MTSCVNCGASFDEKEPRCPHCGQVYIPGAEKEYMAKLHEIREDMSEIDELSQKVYHNEIKKNVKKTTVIVLACVGILLLGVLFFIGISRLFSYTESEEDIKARMLWEKENFPRMDEWYQAGEYRKILEFMEETYQEKEYSFYEWDHYDFVRQYENYEICMEIKEHIAGGEEISEFEAAELLYCGMSIMNYERDNSAYERELYSENDIKYLEQWKKEVEEIFFENLFYSEEELEELQSKIYKEGFLSYEICSDYKKEILKRIDF